MTLEDAFHNAKASAVLQGTLTFDPALYSEFYEHMRSPTMEAVLAAVADCSPQFRGMGVSSVLDGHHGAISLSPQTNPELGQIVVNIDHRFVGGSMFYRLIEASIGVAQAQARPLPPSALLKGVLMLLYNARALCALARRPAAPPGTGALRHMKRRYAIPRRGGVSRRFQAYHAFLVDALASMNREELLVAFSVAFERAGTINNVGLVFVTATRQMTAAELALQFRANSSQAVATNALLLLGSTVRALLPGSANAAAARQKIDLVCTTFAVDETALPCGVSIRPAGPVIEAAYASLFSRLEAASTTVIAAVTTNHDDQTWTDHGFVACPS